MIRIQEFEESAHYMQVGEGHCFFCHQNYEADHRTEIIDHCEKGLQITECTEKCGKWFKSREGDYKHHSKHESDPYPHTIVSDAIADKVNSNWEEEFYEKFNKPINGGALNLINFSMRKDTYWDWTEVKSFISNLLTQERDKERARIRAKVSIMIKEVIESPTTNQELVKRAGNLNYNLALRDLLDYLDK